VTAPITDRPQALPGGAQLAPGETILLGGRFMMSTIVFYKHTEMVLTNRRLYAVRPNLALGLIPVGASRSAYPVENIAGVSAGTRFDVLGIVFGVAALLFGLATVPAHGVLSALGLLLIILGVVTVIGAPKQAIEVMNSGGGTIRFPVSLFERSRAVEFANRVSETIARTSTRSVVGVLAPATPEPVDAAASLRRLESLREQGLITEAEYDAKRSEVLGRL
jgi:hypothetical protein